MRTDGLASLFRPRNSIHTLKVQSVTQLTWPNELSMLTNSVAASSILAIFIGLKTLAFFVVAVRGYPLYTLTPHTQREIKTAERYKKKKTRKRGSQGDGSSKITILSIINISRWLVNISIIRENRIVWEREFLRFGAAISGRRSFIRRSELTSWYGIKSSIM